VAVLGSSEGGLRERRRGSVERAVAAWAAVRYAGLTHQIARWQQIIGREQAWQGLNVELDRRLRNR
jgi:hypothetical protein